MKPSGLGAAVALVGSVLLALACAGPAPSSEAPRVRFLRSEQTASLGLPFSDAVQVGDLLYLSGQVGNVPGTTRLVPGGVGPETRQALENVRHVLESAGSSLDRVVKCSVFLADVREWPAMNEVYLTFFPEHLPARSAFGANGLALGARIEIECIAVAVDR